MYAAIDNGVSGAVAFYDSGYHFYTSSMYTFEVQDYTKAKKRIRRIDVKTLAGLLRTHKADVVVLERPMINPARFASSISAARSLEATLIAIGSRSLSIIDSKKWQSAVLPKGYSGADLKKVSKEVGMQLFPQHAEGIKKQGDADALLMLYYVMDKKIIA